MDWKKLCIAFAAIAYTLSLPRYRFIRPKRVPICPETLRTTAEMIDAYTRLTAQEKREWRRRLKPPCMASASEYVALEWCDARARHDFIEVFLALDLADACGTLTPEARALLRRPEPEFGAA